MSTSKLCLHHFLAFINIKASLCALLVFCCSIFVYTFNNSAMADITEDLIYHLPSDAYQSMQMNINDKTISIPVIQFESQQPISKGVVVVMADLNAQGNAQLSLYEVAKSLPKWGWNTLYVIPQQQQFVVQAKPEPVNEDSDGSDVPSEDSNEVSSEGNGENTTENDAPTTTVSDQNDEQSLQDATAETQGAPISPAQQTGLQAIELQSPELAYEFNDYEMFSVAIWQQLSTQFLQAPGYKILLAQGKTASVALSVLAKQGGNSQSTNNNETLPFKALILTNVYWPDTQMNNMLASLLSKVQLPVLDLHAFSDNHWAKQTIHQRLIQSTINLKPLYRQRQVIGMPFTPMHTEYIAKEVVGWTNYLGW